MKPRKFERMRDEYATRDEDIRLYFRAANDAYRDLMSNPVWNFVDQVRTIYPGSLGKSS